MPKSRSKGRAASGPVDGVKRRRGRPRSSARQVPVPVPDGSASSSGVTRDTVSVASTSVPLDSVGLDSGISIDSQLATPSPIGLPGGGASPTLGLGKSVHVEFTPEPVVKSSSGPSLSVTSAPVTDTIASSSFATDTTLTSVCDDLGSGVPHILQEKIWKGEFVEFGALLKSLRGSGCDDSLANAVNFTIGSNESPAWQIRPHKQAPRITSIEQWTSAFLVFASVYLLRHPTHARQLLKYADTIRSAAFRHVGFGWRDYDIQFRLRQVRLPSRSWASIDAELWLTLLGAPLVQQPNFRPYQQRDRPYASFGSPFGPGRRQVTGGQPTCHDFNRGQCIRPTCRFAHRCSACLAFGHSATRCRRNQPSRGPAVSANAGKTK
ncbi:uncharacterized protein LOC119733864 [Patiria miniata]|uniref:C3H1-type domain-containing protein n=1 Tax=Patiria miniata TaxID=46514 RepID=A0A914AHK0_PATMI|nr:uncharacterized protein LOC119733864 [Patiria miniata]